MPSKVDKIEFEKRIRVVQEWIIDDWPSVDIIAQIFAKWKVEQRQAKRYIAEARSRWEKDEDALLEQKRRVKIQTLKKYIRSLKDAYKGTPAGIRTLLKLQQEIIKLEALIPTSKKEVVSTNTNINHNVKLTDQEILQYRKAFENEY